MKAADQEMPSSPTKKVGWRVKEWHEAIGVSRAYVYLLMGQGRLDYVEVGGMRIITTSPADFLAQQRAARAAGWPGQVA